jgi:sugar/nucleoside kinase (ribokinase family)
LKKNLEEKERLLDDTRNNNVSTFSVPLSTTIDIPTVLVELDGVQRPFIIDTGGAVCLIEPGISDAETTTTNIVPVAITGDQLPLQWEQ